MVAMKIHPKTVLYFSITIIVIYWLYQIFLATIHKNIQSSFSEFATRIAIAKSIQFVSIILLLRLDRVKCQEIGFSLENWKKQLFVGLIFGLIMFLVFNIGLNNVMGYIFPKPANSGSINAYFSEPSNLYIWLVIGIFGGGFVEELMRIFMLTRFQKCFGKPGLYIALACTSIVFGFGHLYQGTGTAISTGISGLFLGVFYLKRKSAIEVITIHAFSDVLAILGAYQMYVNH